MLGDIVKLLVDEPEKLEKAIIKTLQILMNISIAAILHRLAYGTTSINNLDSLNTWINILLSGQLLVCLFFYFASKYVIVGLIAFIIDDIAMLVSEYKLDITSKDRFRALKAFGIVKLKKERKNSRQAETCNFFTTLRRALQAPALAQK